MNRENKKLFDELKVLKSQRATMDRGIYLQKLRVLSLKIKTSMTNDIEVTYEEVKIIDSVNNIIKG